MRIGLLAMITVRDPIGVDQFSDGGHGSAFDRVGAFQVGFTEGVARCAELIDDPLPLVPNSLQPVINRDGNAEFGYDDDQIVGIVTAALNDFWPQALAAADAELPELTVVPVESADDVDCDDSAGDLATGAVYCAASREVFFDEPFARELYEQLRRLRRRLHARHGVERGGPAGARQQAGRRGPRAGVGLPHRGLGGRPHPRRPGEYDGGPQIESGDLDEAIRTALVVGDDASTDDVLGSGFEKIASFREGVLEGIPACTARLPD